MSTPQAIAWVIYCSYCCLKFILIYGNLLAILNSFAHHQEVQIRRLNNDCHAIVIMDKIKTHRMVLFLCSQSDKNIHVKALTTVTSANWKEVFLRRSRDD